MERQRKPPLNKELIKFLDETFPDKLPRSREMTPSDLAFLQGQRMVVDYLVQLFEQEE